MAITINATSIMVGTDEIEVVGTLAISGNYTSGTGDTVNFNSLQGVSTKNGRVFAVAGDAQPDFVSINPVQGYNLEYQLGTNLSNGVMRLFNAAGTEQNTGAYPAVITGDANIFFCATFPKLIPA